MPEGETIDFVVTIPTNVMLEFTMMDEFAVQHPLIEDGTSKDGASKYYRYKGTAVNCR